MRRLPPLLFATCLLASAGASWAAPTVGLVYDEVADERCSAGQPIQSEWASELRSRLQEMRDAWASVEPQMVSAVGSITNKPFAPTGTIRLTLCNTPSNSFFGLSVNMRYALNSFTKTPVPLRYKVDTAFHESLHEFVSRNVPAGSPLLLLCASESACVRNHVHLLALQKAVLLRINDPSSLAEVISIDGQLPSVCYKSAWSLVNATEQTYLQFVPELAQ